MLVDDDAARSQGRIALGTLVLQPMIDLGVHVRNCEMNVDIRLKFKRIMCMPLNSL